MELKEQVIEYKKSAAVMIFNDRGQLALQLRAAHDKSFPSHWDFSAGGGIDPGESGQQSAERELKEELGVRAPLEFVAQEHYSYPAWNPSNTREVDLSIYKTKHNGPFKIDTKEIEKAEFFSLKKIGEMIASDVKFHPEFVLSWDRGIIARAARSNSSNR